MLEMIKTYRVVVFVPLPALEGFIVAIQDDIPSFLGPYDRVLWWGEAGTEQFRPLEGSSPSVGILDATHRESSIQVEMLFPYDCGALKRFIAEKIIPAHPWERPVIVVEEVETPIY
jgi:hypothetical protein